MTILGGFWGDSEADITGNTLRDDSNDHSQGAVLLQDGRVRSGSVDFFRVEYFL